MSKTKDRKWKLDPNDPQSNGPLPDPQGSEQLQDLSADPNAIRTSSIEGPLVIFYGPREVGKTVALIRLSKFVTQQAGIAIRINRSFREDKEKYVLVEKAFNDLLNKRVDYDPQRTGNVDFLLLDFFIDGKIYCQFIEAPGEHYFDRSHEDEPNKPYYAYFEQIRASNYRKVYVFFFEDNLFGDSNLRERYVNKISNLIKTMDPKRDRVLILFNKIDEVHQIFVDGKPKVETLRNWVFRSPEYRLLKTTLENSRLKHIYFVPFSSGTFSNIQDMDRKRWVLGNDWYPGSLWGSIRKSIDKRWRLFG